MGKDCLREKPVDGSPTEASWRDYQVGPEANINVQVLKDIFTQMAKVTYQNNMENQIHTLLFF